MNENLRDLLTIFLEAYPGASGATLQSLETALDISVGKHIDAIKTLNEVTILAIDESFETEFSYIFSELGTIIVFFLDTNTFLTVFTRDEFPNKALAKQMYDTYHGMFTRELKIQQQNDNI